MAKIIQKEMGAHCPLAGFIPYNDCRKCPNHYKGSCEDESHKSEAEKAKLIEQVKHVTLSPTFT